MRNLVNCNKNTAMQKSLVWEGIANDTEEHCSVNLPDNGITVRSEIEGWADGEPVYVEYVLHLDLLSRTF